MEGLREGGWVVSREGRRDGRRGGREGGSDGSRV